MQVGYLYAHPFNQTSTGGLVNLSGLIFMQVLLVVWVASHTANDLFTATENLLCFLVELVATCLLFIANQIAAHADGDPGKLATSLELATVSLHLLIYSCFVPLIFTVYDSFVVPVVQFCWKSDDLSYSETCCQMVVTLILLPITIASTFMGLAFGASTSAGADLLGNAKGTLVGSSSQFKNLVTGQGEVPDAAEPDAAAPDAAAPDAAEPDAAAPDAAAPDAHVPPSKAARKRLKRATFLERVRTKVEALKAARPATPDDNEIPPTIFEVAGRQAAVAVGLMEPRRRAMKLSFAKEVGASAGIVLQPHGPNDKQLMITRIVRDSACCGVLKVGDVLVGVNHLGGAEAPLTGRLDDIEAVVKALQGSTEVHAHVLRKAYL